MEDSDQAAPSAAGKVYKGYIEKRLEEEVRRASSLQARGLAIVTTSGVLVTLLFTIGSVTLRSQQFAAAENARRTLVIAAVAFVVAAVCGLISNLPRAYVRHSPDDLNQLVSKYWSKEEAYAEKTVAEGEVDELISAEKVGGRIAMCIRCGIAFEVVAVAILVLAVSMVVL
jgi:hypothetical protein